MPSVSVNGISLCYEIHGQGDLVLLIHGLGSSAQDWENQMTELGSKYRLIAPDLRGHGRSTMPPGPYRITDFAADLAELLKELAIETIHVVGFSLGGAVAFQLAVDHPRIVRTLTIINSGPEIVPRHFSERFEVAKRIAIVRVLGMKRLGIVIAKRLFPAQEQEPLRRQFMDRFANNREKPYLASLRALIGWSVADRLTSIRCPTLVVAADQDYTPVSLKQAYVGKLPDARLVVIANSRHATTADQPQALNRTLSEFLTAGR